MKVRNKKTGIVGWFELYYDDDDKAIYLSILIAIIVFFLLIFGYRRKSDNEY